MKELAYRASEQEVATFTSARADEREVLRRVMELCNAGPAMEIANSLIDRFGSFARVVNTSHQALLRVPGVTAEIVMTLRTVRQATVMSLRTDLADRMIVRSPQQMIEYFRVLIGHSAVEIVMMVYLNRDFYIIGDEVVAIGSDAQVSLSVKDLVRRALERNAHMVVMAHNHPSGNYRPSKEDHTFAAKFQHAAAVIDIHLLDFIIVSSEGGYSRDVSASTGEANLQVGYGCRHWGPFSTTQVEPARPITSRESMRSVYVGQ